MQHSSNPFPAASPTISTIGFQGESKLRRFRRKSVADVLARYTSQLAGRPATLLDITAAEEAGEAERRKLARTASAIFHQLPQARLTSSGDQLTLITDDLLGLVLDAEKTSRLPETVLSAQRVAIGRSRGAYVSFARTDGKGDIEVFTTRPDTLFGASFVAVSPSHPAAQLADPAQLAAFQAECDSVGDGTNTKAGIPLGLTVRNPFEPAHLLPVWLANFVVDTYGTGAAGGCPACDQRDLDFARRYGLGVRSIICPPGMDPDTYEVGASAHAGDGTIINSGFLSGLPVEGAIDAAIDRLARIGLGRPAIQYRRRPLVVANAVSGSEGDIHHHGRHWRFTQPYLTAVSVIGSPAAAGWRPHVLHVTTQEMAARHLLDARILVRALGGDQGTVEREPWEEVLVVGEVLGSSEEYETGLSAWEDDALRLAVLADTPLDRELEWNGNRYATALKFIENANRLLSQPATAGGLDRASLARHVASSAERLEGALRKRRINTAVAAAREIAGETAARTGTEGFGKSAQEFVASLLYPLLPSLSARLLTAAGSPPGTLPAWPHNSEQAAASEVLELVVQINGKKRGMVRVPPRAGEETVLAAVQASQALNAHLAGKAIRKVIVVPDRLINIVI